MRYPPLFERIDTRLVLVDSDGRERFPYRLRTTDGSFKFVARTGRSGGKEQNIYLDTLEELVHAAAVQQRPVVVVRLDPATGRPDSTGHPGVSLRTRDTIKSYRLDPTLWSLVRDAELKPEGYVTPKSGLNRTSPSPGSTHVNGVITTVTLPPAAFQFTTGCSKKADSTSASATLEGRNVDLLHNRMQEQLYSELVRDYGEREVGTEIPSGTGGRIDVVVRTRDSYYFYEIKTGTTARACIREALPQLLEYSYWPGAQEATQLVVVGSAALDHDATAYLEVLSQRFRIPISYKQLNRRGFDGDESPRV